MAFSCLSTALFYARAPDGQVERYKQLLMKQRDIMIALTQRLNERDDAVSVRQKGYCPVQSLHTSTMFCNIVSRAVLIRPARVQCTVMVELQGRVSFF